MCLSALAGYRTPGARTQQHVAVRCARVKWFSILFFMVLVPGTVVLRLGRGEGESTSTLQARAGTLPTCSVRKTVRKMYI